MVCLLIYACWQPSCLVALATIFVSYQYNLVRLLMSEERGWLTYGLEAVDQVLKQSILRNEHVEAIRVVKLDYY